MNLLLDLYVVLLMYLLAYQKEFFFPIRRHQNELELYSSIFFCIICFEFAWLLENSMAW